MTPELRKKIEEKFEKEFLFEGALSSNEKNGARIVFDFIISTITEVLEEKAQERLELLDALKDMYSQYCSDGHNFMTAGEGASLVLELYGDMHFDDAGKQIIRGNKL